MEFCLRLFLTHGPKTSVSWIILPYLMLCMWSSVESWSYHYSNTTMNWEKAREWCREHYTDMVAMQNKEEIKYLNDILPLKPDYYWIGMRKINNQWIWVGTNKAVTIEVTNWARNEPNNGKNSKASNTNEDCVEMYIKRREQAGKWNDEKCTNLKTALCYTAACKNDSCQNGECVETINSHRCSCFNGFYGERCEHVVTCSEQEVTVPTNGNFSCSHKHGDFSYDSVCQYSCEQGYQLSMSRHMKCTESGKWSEQPPTCELVMCKELSHPERGSMNCTDPLGSSAYQSTCVFTCDEGFVLSSTSDTLRCEESGIWSSSQPSCLAAQCPALSELKNGFTKCQGGNRSYGSTCSFSCIPGYQLVGPSNVTCTSAAVWTESMPQCEAITCINPEAAAPLIAQCNQPLTKLGVESVCNFNCEAGFELQGARTIQCSADGQWSAATPTCKAVQCPALPELENGFTNCEGTDTRFSYESTCSFRCIPGYHLVGPSSVTCTSATVWTANMPRCEALTCRNPEGTAPLITQCSQPVTKLGVKSTCSFNCEAGFELKGARTIQCSADGQWSEALPTCKVMRCPLLEAPENGHINCSNSEQVYTSQCSFTCSPDYSLDGHDLLSCDHHGNWTGEKPTCQAKTKAPAPVVAIASTVTVGGVLSCLPVAVWIIKRMRRRKNNSELYNNSDIDGPPEVNKDSTNSLL